MKSIFLLFLLCSYGLLQGQSSANKTYLLKVGKLYDSEKNVFLKNQEILVKGKKIIKVGASITKPDSAEVINLSGYTVTPGLIDAHTHVFTIQKLDTDPLETDVLMNSDIERSYRSVKIARSFLDAGYTSIRDLGNSGMYLDLNLQRAINRGWVIGPRMIVSGPIISPEDGQFFGLSSQNRFVIDREYTVIRNTAEARQAVKDHISHGVDIIKVVMGDGRLTLPLEEVKAIVETAHAYGMKVTAHATYDAVIATALNAGVDGIEHGYGVSDYLLDSMVKKNVYLVPTIGTFEGYRDIFDPEHKQTAAQMKNLQEFTKNSEEIVKRAMDKGVMVVNGSDMYAYTTKPQAVAAKNSIESYYEGCKKATDVLRTATINAAKACGIDKITGSIKENMMADIVAFEGDMEADFVKSLYKVKFVMKEGEIYLK
ncbi:MAG: amidohydrolase family protein [Chitinophagaceae bacterium]